ncbi:uncharacterized protein LOC143032458 [Oratosquilla oratoria]|uniref:uncharacterized protein LOC143032458 n=1 Tax=Oratosquilla oratoria TaxID=337810 RepID=UPI003F769F18
MGDEESRTVWVGNLHEKVNEELLYELFLQAGPLQHVKHPKDKSTGKPKSFAFICFREESSVAYAIELLNGIALYQRNIRVQNRNQQIRNSGSVGIHTLDPDVLQSLQGSMNPAGSSGSHNSLLGEPPGSSGLLKAQLQIAMLTGQIAPSLLSNPLMNTMAPQSSQKNRHSNYQNSSYQPQHRNNSRDGRLGRPDFMNGPRKIDNDALQRMKSHLNKNNHSGSHNFNQHRNQGSFVRNDLLPYDDRHNNYNRNDDRNRHSNRGKHHSDQRQSGPHDRYDRHRPYNRNHNRY